MRIPKLRYVSAVTLFAMLAAVGWQWTSKGQVVRSKLPAGKWTFSAGPYFGAGYKSTPVDVYAVSTNAARGLSIESVSLRNRASKELKEVKLRWFLRDDSRNAALSEGDTEAIEINLAVGKDQRVNYPVVSFDKIYRPYLKNGVLEGDFRIQVVVAMATFADGSQWKLGDPHFPNVKYTSARAAEGCQKQGCVYNAQAGSYICTANENTFCSVTDGGNSCTESRCAGGDDQ